MMKTLFNEQGSTLRIDILAEPDAQDFITTHASILDSAMQRTPLSETMRQRLQQSNWIFSGIKTFHELNEAFPSLLDSSGERKPFERFLNDVQKIDEKYNRNYLRAEYNFVNASADMAAKWEEFAQDGDRYNLQYRTAADEKVRPAHAALHGITLPPSHPFWQRYFPPNGWNCRCTVVQVRKSKYPQTPDSEVEHLILQNDSQNPKEAMFRFNPGIDQKSVPDYNPYTIRRCQDCDIAKGKINLAFVPENELCQACKLVHSLRITKEPTTASRSQVKRAQKELEKWYKQNLPEDMDGKFPARRFKVETTDGVNVIVNRRFYDECISKYQDDIFYTLKLEYTKRAHDLITKATITNPDEPSIDYPKDKFRVYDYTDDCYRVEMKVRCNRDGNYLHILRVYTK